MHFLLLIAARSDKGILSARNRIKDAWSSASHPEAPDMPRAAACDVLTTLSTGKVALCAPRLVNGYSMNVARHVQQHLIQAVAQMHGKQVAGKC